MDILCLDFVKDLKMCLIEPTINIILNRPRWPANKWFDISLRTIEAKTFAFYPTSTVVLFNILFNRFCWFDWIMQVVNSLYLTYEFQVLAILF